MIEKLARIPVEVDYGSEFRYRDPIVPPDTLTVVISQSGETADTLAAQREAKQKGSKTLAICNVVGSMITREAAGTIYTHAGPGDRRGVHQGVHLPVDGAVHSGDVPGPGATASWTRAVALPGAGAAAASRQARDACSRTTRVYEALGKELLRSTDFLFLGRGVHFPIALEGALKLKEISYIHAEGYPAGEMKHGPNALIDEKLPVVVLATHDPASEESRLLYEKTLSNIQEVKAREGIVIAVVTEGDDRGRTRSPITSSRSRHRSELLLPILEIVPLQLLAYHIAVRRGCDVDQPRNLAKSVTVE